MKVVFDTNALLSATLWDKSVSQKLLFKLIRENVEIFCTKEILEEYKKVLNRDFGYEKQEICEIFSKLTAFLTMVSTNEKVNVVKEDPDDNKIIECALAAKAEFIVTYDKHLLAIAQFREIKILKPEELIGINP